MTFYAGDPISDTVYVEDTNGDPSVLDPSLVFASVLLTLPDASTSTAIQIASGGSVGLYAVSFATLATQPGTYSVLLIASETGVPYGASYDVDERLGLELFPESSVTFADVRMMVAIELRDGIILEATADGSETTFTDDLNLTDSPDQYRSSHAIVITATNLANVGRVVRVDSSSPQTGSMVFMQSLPAATKTGDVLHLVNLGGYGFRPQMYDQVIQHAISSAFPDFLIEAVASSSSPFNEATPTISLPDPLAAVYAIEFDETDDWRTMPPARQAGRWGNGWSLDRANRGLRIDGCWRDEIDGLNYRIRGYARHAKPVLPSDPISIDLTWLLLEVKAKLAARRGTDRTWQQWAVEWGRLAAEARGRIVTPREPDTEFL